MTLRRAPAVTRDGKVVAILSRKRALYSTRRLVEAVKARRQRPLVLDTLRCNLILSRGEPRMTYRGVALRNVHVVIPRIGASITGYGLAVVSQFDMMGVAVLNGAAPIARSRDKLRCLQLLARFGLDIPRTVMARDRSNIPRLLKDVGGLPAIVKLVRGTQGVGVMLASTLEELEGILSTFSDLGQDIVLQEFIAESRGRDVRALVVGDRVVAAMRRRAKRGEFRSNLHRGGRGQAVKLPPPYLEAALTAARLVGLEVAGVDMLETREGPKVLEVNSSPGFEGLERATGVDIAGAIVDHALAVARKQQGVSGQRRVP
ncbi:MAG: ATP-grasp domain-containing protein [Myxococcaceae bacterium]